MNREAAKNIVKNIELITAFAEGKTIQYDGDHGWEDILFPSFDDNIERYRVKPEPIEVEVWYRENKKCFPSFSIYPATPSDNTERFMQQMESDGFKKIKMRQII